MRAGGTRSRKSGNVWQIIYMDLMTTMMVFFVILWSADKSKKTADSDKTGISQRIGDQTVRMVQLPGDVLFASGRAKVTEQGRQVFAKLFGDKSADVLNFDMGGLVRRQLVIHGHTDAVGDKDKNFQLGYERALAVYKEIRKYGAELPDHVVLCTHADNTPAEAVAVVKGPMTDEQKRAIAEARAKNRRISIEDQLVNQKPKKVEAKQ